MALNIKSPETEKKVRLLAQHMGETITQAIDRAVDERLRLVVPTDDAVEQGLSKYRAILDEFGVQPATESWDWKSEMYDEGGLSRW